MICFSNAVHVIDLGVSPGTIGGFVSGAAYKQQFMVYHRERGGV